MLHRFNKVIVLLCLLMVAVTVMAQEEETFELTILHTNDTHSNHRPINGNGGAAIQAAVVKQVREQVDNVLLVDAGDRFTGTLFHTQYLGQDQVQVMNLMGYDAMTLGNHEFDNGDQVLADFVSGLNFPVVTANLEIAEGSPAVGMVEPYTVIEVGGQQIGIIGLVTADTTFSSSPSENMSFSDDYAGVVNQYAAELAEQGINKIIVLSHSGIVVEQEFMAELEGVDVVVGGHSHTLLGNQYEAPFEYPLAGASATGEPIVYVQAGERTQYLGRLNLEFDAAGTITNVGGDVIFLSQYITPDQEMADLIEELGGPVDELANQPLNAAADVLMVGDRRVCRVEECNLGNLIADAMREKTGAQIAIMNGGGIRASVEPGDLTLGDVLLVHPFANLLSTFEATGADVVAALENGVSGIQLNDAGQVVRDGAPGRFPQVSGLRYTIDPTQEAGSRVSNVEVMNEDGSYSPIDLEATYSMATLNFIRQGGDNYTMFAENAINPYDFGPVDYEVTRDYIIAHSPVAPEVEGRITYINAEVEPMD